MFKLYEFNKRIHKWIYSVAKLLLSGAQKKKNMEIYVSNTDKSFCKYTISVFEKW